MEIIIIIIFIAGYILIALEHSVKINKTATALVTAVLCWTVFALSNPTEQLLASEHFRHFETIAGIDETPPTHLNYIGYALGEHLNEIAQILVFLMGAMTIVELIDLHHGFRFITEKIQTKNPKKLLWLLCVITFFLSAVLDNLASTIVMVSLIGKLIEDRKMKLLFVGMIIIAANAGGAWSPIGDITTTMLWIGGQVTAIEVIKNVFLPSLVCLLIPLTYLSFTLKGKMTEEEHAEQDIVSGVKLNSSKTMFFLGFAVLMFVPIFKSITHLPPYLGMMLGLGVVWGVSEWINPGADDADSEKFTAAHALSKIDMGSVLFFLGILLAVGALQAMGTLHHFSEFLTKSISDTRILITIIGLLSAVVDNVPLVAASMAMYSMDVHPPDSLIWEYLAYCAGTGGSILVIGSAAGVAAMGMEKIDFIWYLKKISLLAFAGYVGGAIIYVLINS